MSLMSCSWSRFMRVKETKNCIFCGWFSIIVLCFYCTFLLSACIFLFLGVGMILLKTGAMPLAFLHFTHVLFCFRLQYLLWMLSANFTSLFEKAHEYCRWFCWDGAKCTNTRNYARACDDQWKSWLIRQHIYKCPRVSPLLSWVAQINSFVFDLQSLHSWTSWPHDNMLNASLSRSYTSTVFVTFWLMWRTSFSALLAFYATLTRKKKHPREIFRSCLHWPALDGEQIILIGSAERPRSLGLCCHTYCLTGGFLVIKMFWCILSVAYLSLCTFFSCSWHIGGATSHSFCLSNHMPFVPKTLSLTGLFRNFHVLQLSRQNYLFLFCWCSVLS